jgi:alpha-ribazole phosphatase
MDVYLVRHTTPNVKSDICYGQADVGLASSFDDEFNQFNKKISHLVDPLVFTSPLHRCLYLAQKTVEHFNFTPLKIDERLLELNFGDWELKPWADIPQGVLGEWSDEHIKQAPPNGESYLQLYQRACRVFKGFGRV